MSRYTLAELNRTALDAVTLSTPTGALESLEDRMSALLDGLDAPNEVHDAVLGLFAETYDELDRIEREASR